MGSPDPARAANTCGNGIAEAPRDRLARATTTMAALNSRPAYVPRLLMSRDMPAACNSQCPCGARVEVRGCIDAANAGLARRQLARARRSRPGRHRPAGRMAALQAETEYRTTTALLDPGSLRSAAPGGCPVRPIVVQNRERSSQRK